MSHMITNNKDMAYVGETPWHGLGHQLDGSETLDQWRVAAGLDWSAEKRQVYYSTRTPKGTNPVNGEVCTTNTPTPIKDRFALVRDDTQADLGIVSDRYKIVQPAEIVEFYRDVVADQGFTMETMGSLAGGKRIWALAKMGKYTRIKGQDELGGYLLLATSYDGTMATIAKFTSVRVVCQNTLSFATSSGESQISIGHNAKFDDSKVKQKLGLAAESWEQFEQQANVLASTAVTPEIVTQYLHKVFGESAFKAVVPPNMGTVTQAQGAAVGATFELSNHSTKILNLATQGKGQNYRSANGTLWGLVNAVTEYYDHHAKGKADSRLNSAWFGSGDKIKRTAFNTAMELAKAA